MEGHGQRAEEREPPRPAVDALHLLVGQANDALEVAEDPGRGQHLDEREETAAVANHALPAIVDENTDVMMSV